MPLAGSARLSRYAELIIVSVPVPEPDVHGQAVRCCSPGSGDTEANTEVAAEVVVDDDDARLDQYLLDRNIERADHAADVLQALGRVLDQQRVGAIVDSDAAAIGQHRATVTGARDQLLARSAAFA